MEKMKLVRWELLKDVRGADFVEYIVLAGAVALAGLAGAKSFSSSVRDRLEEQGAAALGVGSP